MKTLPFTGGVCVCELAINSKELNHRRRRQRLTQRRDDVGTSMSIRHVVVDDDVRSFPAAERRRRRRTTGSGRRRPTLRMRPGDVTSGSRGGRPGRRNRPTAAAPLSPVAATADRGRRRRPGSRRRMTGGERKHLDEVAGLFVGVQHAGGALQLRVRAVVAAGVLSVNLLTPIGRR